MKKVRVDVAPPTDLYGEGLGDAGLCALRWRCRRISTYFLFRIFVSSDVHTVDSLAMGVYYVVVEALVKLGCGGEEKVNGKWDTMPSLGQLDAGRNRLSDINNTPLFSRSAQVLLLTLWLFLG